MIQNTSGNVIPIAFPQMINIFSHYLNKTDNKNKIEIHPVEKHTQDWTKQSSRPYTVPWCNFGRGHPMQQKITPPYFASNLI